MPQFKENEVKVLLECFALVLSNMGYPNKPEAANQFHSQQQCAEQSYRQLRQLASQLAVNGADPADAKLLVTKPDAITLGLYGDSAKQRSMSAVTNKFRELGRALNAARAANQQLETKYNLQQLHENVVRFYAARDNTPLSTDDLTPQEELEKLIANPKSAKEGKNISLQERRVNQQVQQQQMDATLKSSLAKFDGAMAKIATMIDQSNNDVPRGGAGAAAEAAPKVPISTKFANLQAFLERAGAVTALPGLVAQEILLTDLPGMSLDLLSRAGVLIGPANRILKLAQNYLGE